jgi:hypothetical protein
MNRRQICYFGLMFLLPLPLVAGAQTAATPELRQVISALRPNALLRVETAGIHTGTLISKSADSLVLRESGRPIQLGIADIRSIAESQRHVRRAAIVGGVLGAVGFGAIGFIARGAVCSRSDTGCKSTRLGGLAAGGVLGLIGGTIGGAAVGLTQRGWRFLYPASE